MFPCRECAQEYSTRGNLKRHLMQDHNYSEEDWTALRKEEKDSEKPAVTFDCNQCQLWYTCERSLRRHNCDFHKINEEGRESEEEREEEEEGEEELSIEEHKFEIICPACDENLKSHRLFVEHVSSYHKEPGMDMKEMEFQTLDEFEAWRKETEKDSNTKWVRRTSRKSSAIYYYCRDEIRISNPKRFKGSRQVCKPCTAHLTMRISNEGKVKITYCSSHYGHEPSLANANLSENEYLIILEKLQRHTCDKDVLNEIHDEFENKKSRMYYVDQDDIKNVRTKFANLIETWRKDADDVKSVEILSEREDYGIVEYHPPKDATGAGLRVVIINEQQIRWAETYGKGLIICDDTYNITQYSIQLSTVMVLDRRDRGLPIGFMLSKNPKSEDWAAIFKAIKTRVPSFAPTTLMTDDSNIFFNGYNIAFPQEPIDKRLCSWHVTRSLNRKLASFKYSDDISEKIESMISVLMRTCEKVRFRDRLRTFVDYIASNAPGFHQYFTKYYINRTDEWCAVERVKERANVTMACEAFHAVLKDQYLSKGAMIRMDRLIFLLGQFVTRRERNLDICDARSKQRTYRQKQCNRRHRTMLMEISDLEIDVFDPFEYLVRSSTTGDYSVIYTRDCTCDVNVNIHCNACGACPYSWNCQCMDSLKKGVACKHIHRVIYHIRENKLQFPHYGADNGDDDLEIDGGMGEIREEEEEEEEGREEEEREEEDSRGRPIQVYREPTDQEKQRLIQLNERSRSRDMLRLLSDLQDRMIKHESYDNLKLLNDQVGKIMEEHDKDVPKTSIIVPRMDRKRKRIIQRGQFTIVERIPGNTELDENEESYQFMEEGERGGREGGREGEMDGSESAHLKRRKKRLRRHKRPTHSFPPSDKDKSQTCGICHNVEPDIPTTSSTVTRWRRCNTCRWWAHEVCSSDFAHNCQCGGKFLESEEEEEESNNPPLTTTKPTVSPNSSDSESD